MTMKKPIFVGNMFKTTGGSVATVTSVEGCNSISIIFDSGYSTTVEAGNLRRGTVADKFKPNVYGVGFIGDGPYNSRNSTRMYRTWHNMFMRCYDANYQSRMPTYAGCTVCEEWCNFQVFAGWYLQQPYHSNDSQLDKDLLVIGNKEYSAGACSLIPSEINSLLTSRSASRGTCPIGVSQRPNGKFYAQVNRGNGVEHIGSYFTKEDAFLAYKRAKEAYIKTVADKYKHVLPQKVYNNLMNYTMSITD